MEENKKKKIIISTIIGVVAMLLIVAGAAYAYFSVPIQNNFTETKVDATVDAVGTVSLLPEVSQMTLNLKASDMMQNSQNVAFYGTKEGTTTVESTEVIAKASVNGNGTFNCTYDLTMNATGTNNMYEAVQRMSSKDGNVILTVNGERYDFATENLFPKTIKGEILGLTEGVTQDITAQIRLVNRTDITQDELQGTDIKISFTMQNFKCEAIEMGSAGSYVMKTSPTHISEEIIEGLYRYQGTKEEVTNNWFCASNNLEQCTTSTGRLFRIIGITPNGELKIVSRIPMFTYSWNNDNNPNISWPYSSLYKYLNNTFVNNFTSQELPVIIDKEWKYGDIGVEKYIEFSSGDLNTTPVSELYKVENTFNNTIKAKFGMLTITDILTHNDCFTSWASLDTCSEGWLSYGYVGGNYEHVWTLTKIGYYNGSQYIFTSAYGDILDHEGLTQNYAVRPVIYLNSNLPLTGTGTETDPYRLAA